MNELLEAVTVVEEVATAGGTVVPADLSTVSQQLDQLIGWQIAQLGVLCMIVGAIIGVAFAKVIGRMWR